MKHFKQFFVCMLMLAFGFGQLWAAEQVAYTLTPAAGTNNGYAGNCDVEIDGITWNVTGNATLVPWRIGGKSLSGVDREVYSKTAMGDAITKVEFEAGAASSITVNTLTLVVASDAAFNTVVDEVSETFTANSTITFNPTTPATQWTTEAYYKFVFNVSVSGTSNKFVEFKGAKFYTESSDVIVKTLKGIEVDGMTTSYEQNDAFSFDGTCTATYSVTKNDVPQADEEETVTPTEVTSPDMSTSGNKTITVSYTEDAITKTTTYDITVSAALPKITIDGSATGITTTDEEQDVTAGGFSFGGTFKQYSTSNLWLTSGTGFIYNKESFGKIRKITINYKSGGSGTSYQWIKLGDAIMDEYEAASTNGVKYETSTGGSSNTFVVTGDYEYFCLSVSNKNLQATSIVISYEADPTAPSVTISPVAVDATAEAANGLIDVTYTNITTASATVGLFNDAECNEAFTGDWLTASLNGDKDIAYTIKANTAFEARTAYIKLTAPASNSTSPDVVKVIAVTQAAREYVFANLAELLENVTPTTTAKNVTVTLTDEVIVGLDGTQGIYLNVTYGPSATTKQIEIYCKNAPTMVAGGTVSGTLENCKWKTFGPTWELCPANWTEITYTAPKAVSSVVVTGAPTKTTYVDGEKFNPAGLTVTVNYTDDTHEVIDASMATWAYNPSQTLAKDQTSVGVQATYNEVQSVEYIVNGLTVGEIPVKTVAEFIAAEGMRCYLVGTVSDIETGTKLKYGNFNLTDASGTIYVYGCLDTEGNAEQFESLNVEDGDKIKVIAETYKYYGSKDEAVNVQFVQKIVVAKISIDNMSMEFGDVATINAAITPAAAANAVTYAIKAGSNDCITLEGDQVTAKSVAGTATIVATISDAPEYDGAVKEFTVTVTAPDTRKKAQDIDGFEAISGNLNEDISYVSSKGDGTSDPKTDGGSILYYQPGSGKSSGGYMTLQAVKGCTIDQVKIITASNNATSIAYSAGEGSLSSSTEVEAGGEYLTPASLNAEVVNIYCTGSDKNHRLYIAQVIVYYTGEPAAVDHLILSGTAKTDFVQGEEFSSEGLVVTASYDAGETDTEDVTDLAIVTPPDMNTAGNGKNVTVSFGGKEASYTINIAVDPNLDNLLGTWKLVTNASALKAGDEIIVAQVVDADGTIYSMGKQNGNNRAQVESTVAGDVLNPALGTKVFTLVDAGAGKFAIQATNGKYLSAAGTGTNNYLKEAADFESDKEKWTITITDNAAKIQAASDNRNTIRYNSGNSIFSCYAESGQNPVALYIRTVSYTRPVSNNIGTLCVDHNVPAGGALGATFYQLAGKEPTYGKLVFDEVTELVAGEPYIFQSNTGSISLYYGETSAGTPVEVNGMIGSFSDTQVDITEENKKNIMYIASNKLYDCSNLVGSYLEVVENRCYIDYSRVNTLSPGANPAPGRRRIIMGTNGTEQAQGIDDLNASKTPVKMMINGQLFILRGEKLYDATGRLVK